MRPIKFTAYVLNENTKYEISTVDAPISKKGANSFKGYEMSAGYVLRKVKGHPNSNSRGYYPLHRLLMEEHLGRLLLKNEVVHHKDGNKTNNEIENLELVENQSKHAKIEIQDRNRNDKGKLISEDPMLENIKFRLYDKERKVTVIYTLSKLINTTYKRSKFEFRGRFTGLHDRNEKEIYEGDIIKTERFINHLFVKWDYDQWGLFDGICNELSIDPTYDEIIGSVYENPEFLENK